MQNTTSFKYKSSVIVKKQCVRSLTIDTDDIANDLRKEQIPKEVLNPEKKKS